MLETLNERLQVSFEKVNTFLSQGDFVKTIFVDFIRNSLERGDFIDLLGRLSNILDIDMEEAQLIVATLFQLNRIEQVENSVSYDSFIFLKMLTITYGTDLQNLRNYTFAENKLLLSESSQYPFDDKIGITVKRLDKEEFYFEANFPVALNFMTSIVNHLRIALKKNDYIVSRDTWDEILNLKGKITLLQHDTRLKGGDLDGGEE